MWPSQQPEGGEHCRPVERTMGRCISHVQGIELGRSGSGLEYIVGCVSLGVPDSRPSTPAAFRSNFHSSFQCLLTMADAFSLAVNIFTVLEFGRKLAVLALDIHKDGQDAVSRICSLDLTSKDLGKIAGELSKPGPHSAAYHRGESDDQIRKLAMRCTKVAERMQETIGELGIHRGSLKKGRALVTALKYKWKHDDIVTFQSEIEDLRSELMLSLILWLRFVHCGH